MYQPPHFRITARADLLDVVRAHPLGLLITAGPAGLMANAVPFVIAGAPGAEILRAHLARSNDQWREIADGAAPLVVFQGVDHYVSPEWYATKRETHKVVPTWNYVMVQVRGPARVAEDMSFLREHLEHLTDTHEAHRPERWRVSDAPDAFVAAQMRAIVGIEIEIGEIVGKFKLSQNRPAADQAGIISGLHADGDGAAMAALIETVRARGREG